MTQIVSPRSSARAGGLGAPALRLSAAPASAAPLEPLLTAAEVAKVLGVRPKRVYELGIPAVRLSVKTLRWRLSDLEAWLDQRRAIS